jgi:hypothetical protein
MVRSGVKPHALKAAHLERQQQWPLVLDISELALDCAATL